MSTYTDEQVERVADRICQAVSTEMPDLPGLHQMLLDHHYEAMARAALEAMTPEPLDGNADYIAAAADEVDTYLFIAAEDDEPLWQVMGRERFSIGSAALRGVDKLRTNAKEQP